MGIHLGSPLCEKDVITKRMDNYGPMVSRASRVSAVAQGGQITISLDYLNELHKLEAGCEAVNSAKKTVAEVYQNEGFGKQIHGEMVKSKEEGYMIFNLGEKKLKGLETPKQISAIYPKELISGFVVHMEHDPNNQFESIADKKLQLNNGNSNGLSGVIGLNRLNLIQNNLNKRKRSLSRNKKTM